MTTREIRFSLGARTVIDKKPPIKDESSLRASLLGILKNCDFTFSSGVPWIVCCVTESHSWSHLASRMAVCHDGWLFLDLSSRC